MQALLASLPLNINNDISIVYYKPLKKKKLREPRVEMAKRIIRPVWAIDPSRPLSEIRKANARIDYGDFLSGPPLLRST